MIEFNPRKRFRDKEENRKKHSDVVVNDHIVTALESAFASYASEASSTDPTAGAKITGARELIVKFLNLAEVPKPQPQPNSGNLTPEPTYASTNRRPAPGKA